MTRRSADRRSRSRVGTAPGSGHDGRRWSYRYFYDCEFIEDGRIDRPGLDRRGRRARPGVLRDLHRVRRPAAVPWVRRNVLDQLPSPARPGLALARARSATTCYEFLVEPLRGRPDGETRAVGLVRRVRPRGAGPAVGPMPALPREIPRFTKDLRQLWDDQGRPPLPDAQDRRHDALVDARHNLARWRALTRIGVAGSDARVNGRFDAGRDGEASRCDRTHGTVRSAARPGPATTPTASDAAGLAVPTVAARAPTGSRDLTHGGRANHAYRRAHRRRRLPRSQRGHPGGGPQGRRRPTATSSSASGTAGGARSRA